MSQHLISYYFNGVKKCERWRQYDKFHRVDGPAYIIYYENGKKKHEEWIQNNELHRLNGPVWIYYYENGNKRYEKWFQHGKLYRLDGPASIEYDENGNIELKKYFINGKRYTENEFYRTIYLIKKFINKIKEKQREKYNKILKNTFLENQGKDLLNLLVEFVY